MNQKYKMLDTKKLQSQVQSLPLKEKALAATMHYCTYKTIDKTEMHTDFLNDKLLKIAI